jgi:hypothetical protein
MKKLIKSIVTIALGCLFGILGAMLLVEWAAGCGETYIDANGLTHMYGCVFLSVNEF